MTALPGLRQWTCPPAPSRADRWLDLSTNPQAAAPLPPQPPVLPAPRAYGISAENDNDAVTGAALPPSTAPYVTIDFWREAVGVVTPHRAQQGLIVTRLQQVFNATGQMADWIRDAADTVERFQGQQRDVIIASYTLGDPAQIAEEDEFLMSLNRFNVIASRARAKLLCSYLRR
ncbi:MAG: AAA domain-containing protein [Spirochaetaceae bacterium]|nr:AAA domain-containing protein [Spirochaetaceae bacterium]